MFVQNTLVVRDDNYRKTSLTIVIESIDGYSFVKIVTPNGLSYVVNSSDLIKAVQNCNQ